MAISRLRQRRPQASDRHHDQPQAGEARSSKRAERAAEPDDDPEADARVRAFLRPHDPPEMTRMPVPERYWRSYGNDPLPTGGEALDEPFAAFPSWFLRIE
jgi:hypothetical protein